MHSEALWCLAGSQSGSISLFSVRHDEGTRVTTLDSHTSVVSCLVLDKEEQTCFSGSWDSKIMHWDLNTGTPIRVYSEHPSQVSCIRLHPKDPNLFSSCSISGSCFQWDIRAPEPITRFPLNSPPWCLSICYHVDGTQLMIGKRNSAVEIYTLDMQLINKLKLPPNSGPVSKVHCMDNGRSLLIGSSDNLRLWDLNYTGKHIPFTILAGHSSGNVSDLIVDSQSRFMISANGNIFTSSWDVNTAKVIPQCFFYIISSVY
ncbi:Transcription factor spt8 [Coelomomyces lativittatus]|nr:Transcription factor spt8 [Coelomomyces lativittatus]